MSSGFLTGHDLELAATISLKLLLGLILGGLIGWDRELRGRPAGMRTHMLVALGVVVIAEVSKAFPGSDPTRISAQIVTGIGFLGAGTILRLGVEIKGLTSAASIWATSGIAMAISAGGPYLVVAVVATFLAWATLAAVDVIERRINPNGHAREAIVGLKSQRDLGRLTELLTAAGYEVLSYRLLREDPDFQIGLHVSGNQSNFIAVVSAIDVVTRAAWC